MPIKKLTTTKTTSRKKSVKRKEGVNSSESLGLDIEKSTHEKSRLASFLNKKIIIPLLVLIVLIGVIYLLSRWLIIAWVDNKPLTRVELFRNLELRYGDEIKEQLLVERLINSEAQKKGISVSADELNAEIKKTEDQVGGNETLKSLLAQQQISESDFQKQLKLQLQVRKMFSDGVSVSDEEVNNYIKENKDTLVSTGSAEIDDKMKAEISEQLKQQKISQNFRTWLQDALKSTRVVRL